LKFDPAEHDYPVPVIDVNKLIKIYKTFKISTKLKNYSDLYEKEELQLQKNSQNK